MGCAKCTKITAVLFLVIGILYLGQDLSWWTFWTLNWYTTLFLLIGIVKFGHTKCPDCKAIREGKSKK